MVWLLSEKVEVAAADRTWLADEDVSALHSQPGCTVPDLAASPPAVRRTNQPFLINNTYYKTVRVKSRFKHIYVCNTYPVWKELLLSCIHIHFRRVIIVWSGKESPEISKYHLILEPMGLKEIGEMSITWIVLISMSVIASLGRRSRAWGQASKAPSSQGTDHCARWSRNSSFQDSCKSNVWSLRDRVWNGARQRTQRTAMNSKRAVVSYKII